MSAWSHSRDWVWLWLVPGCCVWCEAALSPAGGLHLGLLALFGAPPAVAHVPRLACAEMSPLCGINVHYPQSRRCVRKACPRGPWPTALPVRRSRPQRRQGVRRADLIHKGQIGRMLRTRPCGQALAAPLGSQPAVDRALGDGKAGGRFTQAQPGLQGCHQALTEVGRRARGHIPRHATLSLLPHVAVDPAGQAIQLKWYPCGRGVGTLFGHTLTR